MILALLLAVLTIPAFAEPESLLLDAKAAFGLARDRAAAMPAPAPSLFLVAEIDNPWRRAQSPTRTPPESIGAYAAGCLRGGLALPLSGPGYEVMRPSRRRFFGHPRLLAYLRELARAASGSGLGTLLVGDLGQPRGGPTLSGHASHQSGLDVDIWFRRAAVGERLSDSDRETWDSPSVVVPDFERLDRSWDPRLMDVFRLAAASSEVDRIFVNPVIKKTLCARYRGAAWLARIRPWWGHDDHLHVRLTCTAGDHGCVNPADRLPPGDSCDATLEDWFTPQSKAKAKRLRTEPGDPPKMPRLPAACRQVLFE